MPRLVERGVADLRELLALVDSHTEDELGLHFTGFNELYRIGAYYFLAEAFQRAGDVDLARGYWQEVLLRDPLSNFGERAFAQMGKLPTEGRS